MRFHRLVLLVLFFLPSALSADGMSLEQIADLRQVSSVAISPDGERIAYTRLVPRDIPDEDDGPAWSELHVIGPDGESRPFITGQQRVSGIDWHPDSRRITFLGRRGDAGETRLYAIPVDGGEARELIGLETSISDYSFSPDGSRVALVASEPEDEALEQQRQQGFNQVIFEETWQPRRLYIADLEEESAEPRMLELDGSVQSVQWSPAGDRLAIQRTPRQLVDDTLMFKRIRIISPDGEELGRVDNPGKLEDMAWSPDGEHLAFIATEMAHDPREGRLMIAGNTGGEFTNLLPDLEGHVWNVAWLDARTIVFVSHEGTTTRLGSINPDGDGEQTILDPGDPRNDQVWANISVADDGRMALRGNAPAHPNEAYRLNPHAASEARRLTDSNPWLSGVSLARQTVVRYPARDGLEIEGVLFWPLDYEEGERYPLVLNVHGGPEAHYSNGWLTGYGSPAQHMAAEGYFVFFQNYRGSTGRGVEFSLTSQGRPAQEEFDDLVDGIDHLVDEGMVDGERVGITGGSYGGYASAWGATYYSDRFAAAVMNVGISDTISALGTSDIPQELQMVHYRSWPWEDWDMYRESSPIHHVENARTPILILHGAEDPRVDPTQSRILYRYLSLQEDPPPARLVLYPGEGHGNLRAASRWDYSLRLMRWMDHYLQGEGGDPPDHALDYRLEDKEGNED